MGGFFFRPLPRARSSAVLDAAVRESKDDRMEKKSPLYNIMFYTRGLLMESESERERVKI